MNSSISHTLHKTKFKNTFINNLNSISKKKKTYFTILYDKLLSFDRTWQSYYSLIFEVLYYIIFRVNYFFILPIIQEKNILKIGHKETNLLFQKSNLKHSFFIIVHKQFTILQLHATIKTFAFVIIRITINILMVIKNGTREFNLLPVARRSSFN